MNRFIEAKPYPWPYDGDLRPDNTALVIIDMQTDFCGHGGYVDKMGYDLSLTRAPIEPIKSVLKPMREQGFTIIHTREGHRPDLSDLPAEQALAQPPRGHRRRRHRRRRPVRQDPRARRTGLGNHRRTGAAARRDHHRQAGQGLVLRDRSRTDPAHARHRQSGADRHHDRCLRPHDDARSERPRLRMHGARRLLRRDRQGQPRRGAAHDHDAGRRVRHGVGFARAAGHARDADHVDSDHRPRAEKVSKCSNAGKSFGAFRALDSVSIKVTAGTIHALLGENGAGKSTLVKGLVGYGVLDEGQIVADGREVHIASPRDAQALGIGMVYQHFTLASGLSVEENLLLARGRMPWKIDWKSERAALDAFMQRMPFRLPLDAPVAGLAAGEKQKLEILKQLYLQAAFPDSR